MVERSDGKQPSFRSARSVEIPPTSPTPPQQRHVGMQKHGSDPPMHIGRHAAPDRPLQSQRSYELPTRRSYEIPSERSLDLPSRRSWERGALSAYSASVHSSSSSTDMPGWQDMDGARPPEPPGQRQSSGHHRGRGAQLERSASLRCASRSVPGAQQSFVDPSVRTFAGAGCCAACAGRPAGATTACTPTSRPASRTAAWARCRTTRRPAATWTTSLPTRRRRHGCACGGLRAPRMHACMHAAHGMHGGHLSEGAPSIRGQVWAHASQPVLCSASQDDPVQSARATPRSFLRGNVAMRARARYSRACCQTPPLCR